MEIKPPKYFFGQEIRAVAERYNERCPEERKIGKIVGIVYVAYEFGKEVNQWEYEIDFGKGETVDYDESNLIEPLIYHHKCEH
ncbi:MAG TPA: hypothetical protein VGD05_14070 [Pyrinomonadaceae bacterium]|jgi:hypothetical protein